ncbi:sugar transferase [Alicyclobacillus ferrooxydans]|uniref:sugar transferase n=1 Tax=Alicyclobacillus ferrooxydans TaxID=471514 RepID=UPI0006D5A987
MRAELIHLNQMSGPVFKIANDPRITRVGGFLRKTSLDELPQLFNVLRGHMSLVGPRPPQPTEVDQYNLQHARRLSVNPGITCLWQIGGRNEIDFEDWMQLDLQYIDTYWSDVKILFRTPCCAQAKGCKLIFSFDKKPYCRDEGRSESLLRTFLFSGLTQVAVPLVDGVGTSGVPSDVPMPLSGICDPCARELRRFGLAWHLHTNFIAIPSFFHNHRLNFVLEV